MVRFIIQVAGWRDKLFNRKYSILVLLSCLLLLIVVKRVPQGLIFDTAWQLKALQQYLNKESPTLNHIVLPSYEDLSRDNSEWIFRWPPGTQLLVYPLVANGMRLGDAVRAVVIICIILGSLGWMRWFRLFRMPRSIEIFLTLSLPWMHYCSRSLFEYSSEVHVYALSPWLLLASYHLYKSWSANTFNLKIFIGSIFLGFGLAINYILKNTGFFVSLGIVIFLGLQSIKISATNNGLFRRQKIISFILVVIFCLVPVGILNFLNYQLESHFNFFSENFGPRFYWQHFIYIIANPALAMADADSLWKFILLNPSKGLLRNLPMLDPIKGISSLWLGLIGIPGGLLLLYLVTFKAKVYKDFELLSRIVFFTGSGIMLLIWFLAPRGSSYRADYLACCAMAVLPLIINRGIYLWKYSYQKILKNCLSIALIFYIIIPLLYGYISVVGKTIRLPRDYRIGRTHFYNRFLAYDDIPKVYDQLMADFTIEKDVWYLTEPYSALDLSGRSIIILADETGLVYLEAFNFLTNKPLRVHVLLPSRFEKNGKGRAIRNSFIQASSWVKKDIVGSDYICWIASLGGTFKP
jgi:hypothetical protein